MDFADLAILDFSKMKTYEGRAELSTELRRALSTQGFFYIVNHGYTQTQVNHNCIDNWEVLVLKRPSERPYL